MLLAFKRSLASFCGLQAVLDKRLILYTNAAFRLATVLFLTRSPLWQPDALTLQSILEQESMPFAMIMST